MLCRGLIRVKIFTKIEKLELIAIFNRQKKSPCKGGFCLSNSYLLIRLYSSSSFGESTISILRFLESASAVFAVSIG